MISVVGLNGEQLLDSIMTVKIRDDFFSGNKVAHTIHPIHPIHKVYSV